MTVESGRTHSRSISTETDRWSSGTETNNRYFFLTSSATPSRPFSGPFFDHHSGTNGQLRPWLQMKTRADHRLDRVDLLVGDCDWNLASAHNRNHTRGRQDRKSDLNIKAAEQISGEERKSRSFERSDHLRLER